MPGEEERKMVQVRTMVHFDREERNHSNMKRERYVCHASLRPFKCSLYCAEEKATPVLIRLLLFISSNPSII